MKKRILMVDDDADLSFIISEMLTEYGYEVTYVENADMAFEELEKRKTDLIILDINLPRVTGFEICEELRKVSSVPVIFASARTHEDDRIKGYDIGGDDYIEKPYSMKELLSRVNALWRRTYGLFEEEKILEFGDVYINISKRKVKKNNEEIQLSLREFDVLLFLCKNLNKAVSKEKLLNEVWGPYQNVEPSTVTVHIRWLREKIEDDPANPKYIKTVRKVGYMLEV